MIRRKLDEDFNNGLKRLVDIYNKKRGELNPKEINRLYSILYEDVDTVNTIFIHNSYANPDYIGYELFEEVKFKDGDKHYFITECYDNKFHITEVKLTEEMDDHKEYLTDYHKSHIKLEPEDDLDEFDTQSSSIESLITR